MTYYYSDDERCDSSSESQNNGTIGVTLWGPRVPNLTINTNSYVDIYFTPTQPKCYNAPIACMITFNAYATANVNPDVQLLYYLNDDFTPIGGCSLSGIAYHGGLQAYEFVFSGQYDDTGAQANKFRIRNTSTNTTVILDNIEIVRIYEMVSLNEQHLCSNEVLRGTHDTFDATRVDYPCNFEKCGGRSFTTFEGGQNIEIQPNSSHEWTFNWSNARYSTLVNYLEEQICLFNFNQVYVTSTDTSSADVKLEAYINNTKFAEYYISNQGPNPVSHGFFPTYNLATLPNLYNPFSNNCIKLKNCSTQVSVRMADSPCINVYRVYKTKPCCPTISSSAGFGGTISPTPGPFTIPTSGRTFSMSPYGGYQLSNVSVDGTSKGSSSPYTVHVNDINYNLGMEGHQIVASFACSPCQTCNTCQTACELNCQTGCQVSCQTGCEVACQTGCEVTCQTGCEVTCQTGCEVSCQLCYTCQNCQTACELSCQTGCQVACQTTCELACQTGCEVSCQTGCEVSCQTGCQVTCQWGCEVNCQDECYITCQSCVTCQSACELACQDCQTGCQVACQGCQTCVSCETAEWCPSGYYECYWCETCQPAYT